MSFSIKPGQTLGLVGESGCGKSVTASSVMLLLPKKTSEIVDGTIMFRPADGQEVDIAKLDPDSRMIRRIRGNEISMIFQEPLTSLSPVHTVGRQIAEVIELHQNVDKREARLRTIDLLQAGGHPQRCAALRRVPASVLRRHAPARHDRHGALVQPAPAHRRRADHRAGRNNSGPDPGADEVAARKNLGMAILIITHDLGVIAETADDVAVMYMGRIVERADVRTIFHRPLHPYTVGLMRSIPKLGDLSKERLTPIPGSVPDPFAIPTGCAFYPRCPAPKRDACSTDIPLVEVEPGHWVRCTLYGTKRRYRRAAPVEVAAADSVASKPPTTTRTDNGFQRHHPAGRRI